MIFRIVRVFNDKVSIASSDRTFFDVPIEEIDFDPKVGDVVQCFRNGEKIIVCKIEPQGVEPNSPVENPLDGGALEKNSRVPWIVGIILLLLGVLLGFIYLNNNNVGTMTDPRDGKTYKTVVIET